MNMKKMNEMHWAWTGLAAALLAALLCACPVAITSETPPEYQAVEEQWPEGTYYVAVDGNDENDGSIDHPFATITRAQQAAQPGDTVYFRGGVYRIPADHPYTTSGTHPNAWAYAFTLNKSGTNTEGRINYWGYKGERVVFDFSDFNPYDKEAGSYYRIFGFYVSGSYLHFRNFEITGVRVNILVHTQSECIRVAGGNYNIFEQLSFHGNMGIGWYLLRGSYNLVLNCDAYNNWDYVSEGGSGENTDGFGVHAETATSVGNVLRGCRAWLNSDDGFDIISCAAPVTIENCWSFYNGYALDPKNPAKRLRLANGIGFKGGGWDMRFSETSPGRIPTPENMPRHTIQFCLAVGNPHTGFYSNHHLGGSNWYNNTAYANMRNFSMLNRKSIQEVVDVDGYGHVMKNNVSYRPARADGLVYMLDYDLSEAAANTFDRNRVMALTDDDFVSFDESRLYAPRKADGSLPDIDFMRPSRNSQLADRGVPLGFPYYGSAPDIGYAERR